MRVASVEFRIDEYKVRFDGQDIFVFRFEDSIATFGNKWTGRGRRKEDPNDVTCREFKPRTTDAITLIRMANRSNAGLSPRGEQDDQTAASVV